MKRIISGLFLFAVCSSAMADNWVLTASNSNDVYSIQKGSFSVINNKNGEEIAVVTGKTYDKKTKHINLVKWYVTTADCSNKQGKLITLSLSGEYKFENDFVSGAGSMASVTAETICYVFEQTESNKKSI